MIDRAVEGFYLGVSIGVDAFIDDVEIVVVPQQAAIVDCARSFFKSLQGIIKSSVGASCQSVSLE